MYTQQSNALAAALAMPAGQQQNQALLQVFANCVQGLRTNGPVSINSAAGSRAPPSGVINSPPGAGDIRNSTSAGAGAYGQYLYGDGNRPFNNYPSNVWNTLNYSNPYTNNQFFSTNLTNNTTNQGGNTANYFGGDTFYGDNYLTTNTFSNPQSFNFNTTNDFYNYNNYNTTTNNSVNNNNVSNWYNNEYTDNSYNDFSTTLNTTQNNYNQTVNNFEGDSYFDNTINQGDVINQSTVINQGDVINQGNTYIGGDNTYVTGGDTVVNLSEFITNVVMNIVQGNGRDGKDGKDGIAKALQYKFTGTSKKVEVEVKVWKFNPETCTNDEEIVTAKGDYTPEGNIVADGH